MVVAGRVRLTAHVHEVRPVPFWVVPLRLLELVARAAWLSALAAGPCLAWALAAVFVGLCLGLNAG